MAKITRVPATYFWGSIGYHRLSAFGQFAYPPASSSDLDGSTLTEEPPAKTAAEAADGGDRSAASPEVFFGRRQIEDNLPRSSLVEALHRRRSTRSFASTVLDPLQMSSLLWAAYGHSESGGTRRTAPSAGAVYPLRWMLVTLRVAGLDRTIWKLEYTNDGVGLTMVRSLSVTEDPASWFVTEHIDYQTAAALVVAVGDLDLAARSYGERGYRMMHLDAGHALQNLTLAATLMSIPHVLVAGFDDERCGPALLRDPLHEVLIHGAVLGGSAL